MDEVWYVQGDEDELLFLTKMDAELFARHLFPDEHPDARYARIFFRQVYTFQTVPAGYRQPTERKAS